MTQSIALVSGGNRGIGKEICKQLASKGVLVLLGSRDRAQGEAAAAEIHEQVGGEIEVVELDVSSAESIQAAAEHIKSSHGRLDILVNNAGVFLDNKKDETSVFNVSVDTIQQTLLTNLYGPLQLIQQLVPLMQKQSYGRIVNLSSGMGQLSEMGGGSAAYRISKTSLNALTKIVHAELKSDQIKINAICPGWVKTDMGGENAQRTVTQGADTAVWLATLNANGPNGGFFRDRQQIDW